VPPPGYALIGRFDGNIHPIEGAKRDRDDRDVGILAYPKN
jgi:hypothetical protein